MRLSLVGVVLPAALLLGAELAAAQGTSCDQEQSRMEVQRLIEAGVILSVDQFPPLVTVRIDERGWARTDNERKKRMAQHIVCSIGGPADSMLRTVIFRAGKNNRELGIYSKNELTVE